MKHLALLLVALLSGPALAAWPDTDYDDQAPASGGAPTLATDGLPMLLPSNVYVRAYNVTVCAESGRTLSGAGVLRAWVYQPNVGLWARNPDLDWNVRASSVRCQSSVDLVPSVFKNRRVYYEASGVTVSGGTTVRIWITRSTSA